MAGYDGFSKSNNAIDAEARNCFPPSRLAKLLGVKAGAVQAILSPSEWHHTSSRYNRTDYYDGDLLLMLAAGSDATEDFEPDEIAEAAAQLAQLQAWKPPAKRERIWTGCTVTWLEWGGTRARPKATEREEPGCTVDWKGGAMCVVTFANGSTMRKKTTTSGFEVLDKAGDRIYF